VTNTTPSPTSQRVSGEVVKQSITWLAEFHPQELFNINTRITPQYLLLLVCVGKSTRVPENKKCHYSTTDRPVGRN
jgi:hypothetical protein